MPLNFIALSSASGAFLSEILVRRRRQIWFRLAMMALMVAFFWRYCSVTGMCCWAVVYTGLQVWEYFALAAPAYAATPRGGAVTLTTIAFNSIVFGLPSVLWAHFGGVLGLVCGAYLLSGAMLNTVLTTRGCRPAFIASITPFILYVLNTAVVASGYRFNWPVSGTVGIAGAMMCVSALSLWGDATKTQRSEEAALVSLSEREAELARALQRAEDASHAKSAFLANMSHELRTPLNGVLGMASVLARTALSEKQEEMLEVIASSAQNLRALLSDVLDLAKIEAAQVELQTEPVTPAAIARSVHALFEGACVEKGLSFTLQINADAEKAVLTDAMRLTQILTNLCSNAVKFTETGGLTLAVQSASKGARRRVQFRVSDTGIGISEGGKTRLFERFAQADGSITRRFGGTGLGLSICKNLVDLMGGDIEVASREGSGSTFIVSFDLEAAETPVAPFAPQASPVAPKDAVQDRGRLRVLLVEDHPVNRQVVQLILSEVAEVAIAVNGEEGVSAATARPFDAILMDMQMPLMDGVTATRAIRAFEAEHGLRRTPIIMLTANAMSEHLDQSTTAGADLHLVKPITAEALLTALEAVMQGSDRTALPAQDVLAADNLAIAQGV